MLLWTLHAILVEMSPSRWSHVLSFGGSWRRSFCLLWCCFIGWFSAFRDDWLGFSGGFIVCVCWFTIGHLFFLDDWLGVRIIGWCIFVSRLHSETHKFLLTGRGWIPKENIPQVRLLFTSMETRLSMRKNLYHVLEAAEDEDLKMDTLEQRPEGSWNQVERHEHLWMPRSRLSALINVWMINVETGQVKMSSEGH